MAGQIDSKNVSLPEADEGYWFETGDGLPYLRVIHPEGHRLNRRAIVYMLLAVFGGVPIVVLAKQLGASPLATGVAYCVFTFAAIAIASVWYVRAARPRMRVIPAATARPKTAARNS